MNQGFAQLVVLLRFYAYGLWDRRWSILLVAWVVCVGGWIAVAMIPNRYTATAQVYIDTDSLLGPLMSGLAAQRDLDAQVDVVRRTLLARPNMEELARDTDLDLRADTPIEYDRLLQSLASQIQLETQGRELFRISYGSQSPQVAQRVVEALLNIFVEKNLGASQNDADRAERFLEQQIARYERQLREAEKEVADFKREHSSELSGSDRALRQIDQQSSSLRSLEEELASLQWTRNQLGVQLSNTPEYITSTTARGLSPKQQELQSLRSELSTLLLTFTEKHPDVIATRNRIERLEKEVGSSGSGGSATSQTRNPEYTAVSAELDRVIGQIDSVKRRIEDAKTRLADLEEIVQQTPAAEAELVELTRDYNTIRANYEELVERRESARLAREMKTDTSAVEFRIIEPPIVPVTPSGPPHGLYMAAVLFAGLGAGVALALLRLQLAGGFQTREDLASAFGLPVLGTISKIRMTRLPGTVLEGAAFGSAISVLLLAFAGIFYLYQMSDQKPDFSGLVSGWDGRITQEVRQLL